MDENMISAANPDEEIVEASPAEEETREHQELAAEEQEPELTQEPTETQRVARRIREASQKSVDDFVKAMGMTNPYDSNRPITSRAEYEAYAEMKRLDEAGAADPVAAYRNREMENELNMLRANEQMRQLEADPKKGATFAKLRPQVEELMEYCRNKGTPCTVNAAFNAVLSNSYFDLQAEADEQAKSDVLRKISSNAKASPGALGAEADTAGTDYGSMSDAEFDRMFEKALRGELRNR